MIRNSVIRNVGHAREGRVITSVILQLTITGLLIGMLAWMGLAAAATAQQKSVGSAACHSAERNVATGQRFVTGVQGSWSVFH